MNYLDYLRTDKFPHFWCSGCGSGNQDFRRLAE